MRAVTRLHDVVVPHAGNAFYGMCEAGKPWVVKSASVADVTAEAMGWFVAEHLEVPTAPAVAVVHDGSNLQWLSGYMRGVAEWSAPDISSISNPDDLGRMMVLDVLIGNEDRHARNLLISPRDDGPHVVAIDMAAARVGNPGMFSTARGHDISRLAAGIVSRVIRSGMDEAVDALSSMDDGLIYQWCVAAGHAAGLRDQRVNEMCDELIARRDACPALVCQFVEDLDAREAS